MKQLIAVLLAATLALTLCACNRPPQNETTPTTTSSKPMEAPATVHETATTFIRAYFTRDYATRFSMTFYNSRQQWEDNAIQREGSVENFLALVQQQANDKNVEATIDSFDSYYHYYHKFILGDMLNMYGKYTLTVDVTESIRLDEEALSKLRSELLANIDAKYIDADAFHSVTDAYRVVVRLSIDGEKKDHSESYQVSLVQYDGRWQVATHSI